MIPKIIHYVWFGGEKPQSVLDNIESWKLYCPDYEIREWNETNCEIYDCAFLNEARAVGKYGFVSDVIRLFVLCKYGGIYLDTDVRLLSTMDPFLCCPSFIGKELPFRLSSAVIGSQPNISWIQDFLKTYLVRGRHFIDRFGNLDLTVNTILLTDFLNCTWHKYKYELVVFPEDYFCCKSYFTKEITVTKNSVAIHDFSCSWRINKGECLLFERFRNAIIRLEISIKSIL